MKEKNDNYIKINFLKQIGYSISKIERYPDMAAEGLKRALGYLVKIIAIFTVVVCIGMVYQTNNLVQKGIEYLKNEFPDFSYKEGALDVSSENTIRIDSDQSFIGKVIINTKTDDENRINKYVNELTENGEGIIVLKDKLILKNSSVVGTISYQYNEMFGQMGISEFTKQDLINYANSSQILSLYVSLFLTIFVYSFVMYFLTTISNVVLLSVFGYITTLLARIKMRYVAIFNMSVYAISLSVLLNLLYIVVNLFIPFSMEYFQVMYIAVAAIYLVAAILILKADFIKKQAELTKISKVEEDVKKETEENEEQDNKEEKTEEQKEEESLQEENEKDNSQNEIKKDKKSKDKKEEKENEKGKNKKDEKEPKKKVKSEKNNKEDKKENEKRDKNKKRRQAKSKKDNQEEDLDVEPEGSNA